MVIQYVASEVDSDGVLPFLVAIAELYSRVEKLVVVYCLTIIDTKATARTRPPKMDITGDGEVRGLQENHVSNYNPPGMQ